MYYQMGVHPPSNTKVKSWGSSHTQTLAGALAWHLVTSTLISRGRRGTYGTGWRPWVAGVALGDIHLDITSFCVAGVAGVAQMALGGALGLGLGARDAAVVLRGRRGTNSHLPSFCVAGVAQMALGGALGLGLGARDAAAFCVAGAAQTHIYRRFAWQGRHKLTSTVILCGRCGTDGTGWRAWTWFGRA